MRTNFATRSHYLPHILRILGLAQRRHAYLAQYFPSIPEILNDTAAQPVCALPHYIRQGPAGGRGPVSQHLDMAI